jgi:hypothetical protein
LSSNNVVAGNMTISYLWKIVEQNKNTWSSWDFIFVAILQYQLVLDTYCILTHVNLCWHAQKVLWSY